MKLGKGAGTQLIKEFIEKMKTENVDLIYLFAEYDPLYYEDEEDFSPSEGLKRLVKFYEKLGFSCAQRPNFDFNQIDMFLEL